MRGHFFGLNMRALSEPSEWDLPPDVNELEQKCLRFREGVMMERRSVLKAGMVLIATTAAASIFRPAGRRCVFSLVAADGMQKKPLHLRRSIPANGCT